MSTTKAVFYNLFWQSKACQNLFLLSKEELLDTNSMVVDEENKISVSFPRIILSNLEKNAFEHSQIAIRTQNHTIHSETILEEQFEKYKPIVLGYLQGKFGKAFQKFGNDLEKKPIKTISKIITAVLSGEDVEKNIISLLQDYGFIGPQINSFESLQTYFEKETLVKNVKSLFNEETLRNLFEFIGALKNIYLNELYKGFYSSNQILVNSLHEVDNFEDRLKLFDLLYESKIIHPSSEETFVECNECDPGQYRGTIQLKIKPTKSNKLVCPNCGNVVRFFVPYNLDKEIYDIIKSKDGLLLNAAIEYLNNEGITYQANVLELNDIEIDCRIQTTVGDFIIESKMYKINTERRKLQSKLKEHSFKLKSDCDRLDEAYSKKHFPILLVNINDMTLINELIDGCAEKVKIISLFDFMHAFKKGSVHLKKFISTGS